MTATVRTRPVSSDTSKSLASRFEDVFRTVGQEVEEMTGGKQAPWRQSNVNTKFYLVPLPGTYGQPRPVTSSVPADYQAGLAAYTEGDYAIALREFRPLAEQGDADAQRYLGLMYANGEGVREDDAEAVRWLRKAAEQGDAVAQGALGEAYSYGYGGLREDDAEAVRWYRMAAEQGDAVAQGALGEAYSYGSGVRQDDVTAYMWYILAEEGGDKDAAEAREALSREMTRTQIAEARRKADEWREWLAELEGVAEVLSEPPPLSEDELFLSPESSSTPSSYQNGIRTTRNRKCE